MTIAEIKQRLATLQTAGLLNEVQVSETAARGFLVFLTLHPHVPVTERLMLRLEATLGQKIARVSILRTRANVVMLRFTLKTGDQEDTADRVQEMPPGYPRPLKRVPLYLKSGPALRSDSAW
jgi:hypothetical protein